MKKKAKLLFSVCLAVVLIAASLVPASVSAMAATAGFASVGGHLESIYALISGVKDSDVTAVSYSGTMNGQLTGENFEFLVRDESNGVRIDIPGLKAGTYTLTVTTKKGTFTQSGIKVTSYDRSGYAHFNYSNGVGAYNDDGTLKSNAIVLYVTDSNKNSVTINYNGTTVKGIGNILNSVGKECGEAGHEGQCKKVVSGKTIYAAANSNQGIIEKLAKDNVPLVIRFIGTISESGLYKSASFNANCDGLIDGLTAYNHDDFGGSVKDNGHMARIKSGKDITIEGIGTGAVVDGWGFHFMAESANPSLGKSFEVRNLTFINTPEDAIGMEGVQVSANTSSDLSASVERCWIHNNEFYCPNISSPAESDKAEGDGSVDFKRGQYFTCSYNYFEGCHKTNLVGSSDSSLQFNLTYHHNYWKLCKARGPLARNANIHMYNNVFEQQTDYAMDARANSYIFSEYNLFYMTKNPQKNASGGVIKSYNDSFSSCINYMAGVVVTNKNQKVANNCKFAARNIDYSSFETNASLSYIPTGNYQLQESITEARKVVEAYAGTMKENPVAPANVKMSDISYIPSNVTVNAIGAGATTLNPGKINKTVYAFETGTAFDITIQYQYDTAGKTGILVNEAGECFLTGSGTVQGLPAGKYMVQPDNFQPGDGKTLTDGQFKGITINSIDITTSGAAQVHTHDYKLTDTKNATCTSDGVKTYTCMADGNCDAKTYTEVIPATGHSFSSSWTVDTEPTETTPGSKSHHCTKCDAKTDITEIPATGTTTPDPVDPVVPDGSYVHNFTKSGLDSSVYTIQNGNLSTIKGTVKYSGLTLTQCLKMESKTNITFTAPSNGTLKLVFGGSTSASGKRVKVNGTYYNCDSNGIASVSVNSGNVTITKGDSINLFYIDFEPAK